MPREDWKQKIAAWTESQPAIRAILLVGSQARRERPADEWSDFDFMVFVTDFAPYLTREAWAHGLGKLWLFIPFQEAGGEPQRLVVFEGGEKVDFHFFAVEELAQMARTQTLDAVYLRGYEVVADRDRLAAQLPPSPFRPPPFEVPSAGDFKRELHLFFYGVLQTAKLLGRRDLWSAKESDHILKRHLLLMMEWHAHAVHGADYDTWHSGRFLLEWVDQPTGDALTQVFGRFDSEDGWRALLATVELYRRLALATATAWVCFYPAQLDDQISDCVHALHRRSGPASP